MSYTLHPVSWSAHLQYDCHITSQWRYWHWQSNWPYSDFNRFTCIHVWVFNSMQWPHMWIPMTTTVKIHNNSWWGSLCHPFIATVTSLPSPSLGLVTTNLFSIFILLSSQACYKNGIIQYVNFEDWLHFTQHNYLKIQASWCMCQ